MSLHDLSGQRFGRLYVVARAPNKGRQTRWLCKCDCGTEKAIEASSLVGGQVVSCGCYHREVTSTIHKSHGCYKTRLHNTWQNMKQRCFNPNYPRYKDYGGKGITMCDAWKDDFEVFMNWSLSNGYTDTLTIDRIDNDGNYEPDNCRWITNEMQQLNRRNNRNITYKDKTLTVTEWSKITGMGCKMLQNRLDSGRSINDVFETPKIKNGYSRKNYIAKIKEGTLL